MRERPNPPLRARDVPWIYWTGPRRRDPYRTPWWLHVVTWGVMIGSVVAFAELDWSKPPAVLGAMACAVLAQALCGWLLVLWYGPEPEGETPPPGPEEETGPPEPRRRLRRRNPRPEALRDRPQVSLIPPDLRDEYEADERHAADRRAAGSDAPRARSGDDDA
ncbi:hypothetical protein [Patulibacter sp.]|uniref:hypothetical protein n=1 Tax=Patulibacter sp. TaxID=1912859 RepID=UPI00271D251A|nr:hypothetical protein [Patulibacter sp.]MDO9410566.1 hypothetical protein [Patulibacter sp.]